ncbi:hypothetical protein HU200_066583 [Digitaria exilis]|uniref:Uncharacterized protein n=1 Tax=Digitaria exilis TaxID=1010633 RepID=A0A834ZWF8_9POAL|nr:hypothetical protein HU200_066583 [Digitaria exilis]
MGAVGQQLRPRRRDASAAAARDGHRAGRLLRRGGRRRVRPLLRHRRLRTPALSRGGAEAATRAAPKHGRRGLGPPPRRPYRSRGLGAVRGGGEEGGSDGGGAAGCAPRVMWEGIGGGHGGCVEEANELIEGFNARLATRLDDLRPQLPGADVVFCDVYKGMMEIISNPSKYGDEGGVLRAGPFQGVGRLPEQGDGVRHAGASRVVGSLHPHGRRGHLLADWSWSSPPTAMTTTNICTPVSLQQLVAAHGLT